MSSVTSGSGKNLSQLFVEAATEAFENAGVSRIGAMYVGNMMSCFLQKQEHLGSLMATILGRDGIASYNVERVCSSGGVATNAGVKPLICGIDCACGSCGENQDTQLARSHRV